MVFCIECGAGKESEEGQCEACGFEEEATDVPSAETVEHEQEQGRQSTSDPPSPSLSLPPPPPPPPLSSVPPAPPALPFDESDIDEEFLNEKPPPPPQHIKFSTMTSDFAALHGQATSGVKQILAIKELFQHVVKAEQEHTKKLEKALTEEHKTVAKIMDSDGVVMHLPYWNGVVAAFHAKIAASKQVIERIVIEVIDPLNTLERTATLSLKNISNTMKDLEQTFKKSVDAMNKSKDACRKTLESMQEYHEKEKLEPNPKKKVDLFQKQSSFRALAGEQAKMVVQKVAEANAATAVFQVGLHGCLDLLEELEMQRLIHVTARLEKWVLCLKDTESLHVSNSKNARELIKGVDADKCLSTFIFDWVSEYGEPTSPEPLIYDLPLTSEEIKSGNVLTKGFQMFHIPLLQLLEKEKNANASLQLSPSITASITQYQEKTGKPLDVPIIMHVLCEAIKEMGGLQTQGIFRISIETNLLIELQKQFDSGNFSLELMKGDPHAPACLLKLWLRCLSDPIIHRDMYRKATEGLQSMKSSQVQQRRETGKEYSPDHSLAAKFVLEVFQKLSLPYQALSRRICSLCKEIVANTQQNLMSYDALAVVFAPCFFRSPKIDDPMEGMQQSQREKMFVCELLTALGATL